MGMRIEEMFRMAVCGFLALMLSFSARAENGPIGLVLSGGGAKGAYEVGVWKVLQEEGLSTRVKVISGTSVGAINAVLFATRPTAAQTLWRENMKDVFTFNTNSIGRSVQTGMNIASDSLRVAEKTGESWRGWAHFLIQTSLHAADKYVDVTQTSASCDGYLDSSRLAVALYANFPSEWPSDAPTVYATAVEKGPGRIRKTWRLNDEPRDRRVLMIRASAAVPVGFDTVEIDGKTYVDGGWEAHGGDNVPITPILENHPEVRTVIVVYLDDVKHLYVAQRERVRRAATRRGVNIVEIIPTKDISGWFGVGGMFDNSPETVRLLFELGEKDAREALKAAGLGE